jgi:hypothetical protein
MNEQQQHYVARKLHMLMFEQGVIGRHVVSLMWPEQALTGLVFRGDRCTTGNVIGVAHIRDGKVMCYTDGPAARKQTMLSFNWDCKA